MGYEFLLTSQDNPDTFNQDEPEYERFFKELCEELKVSPGSLRDVLDLGCGFGASTLALGRVFKSAHIDGVSVGDFPRADVIKELGRRLTVIPGNMRNFLKENSKKYDLISIAHIDRTGLEEVEDYGRMADGLKDRGMVITQGILTKLDEGLMGRFFNRIQIVRSIGDAPMVWMKK